MSLRFMHIPKTAGSTFENILKRQYRERGQFSFSGDIEQDIARFQGLSESERNRIGLFTGHAPISTGLQEADGAKLLTFLRDPIRRVQSFCQHVSEGKSPYLMKDFPSGEFNLDKFLASGNAELSNLQTKMLSNSGDCASPTFLESMSPSAARDLALENLYGRVGRFGLAEFFDESVVLFCQSLNWSLPVYVSTNRKDAGRLIKFNERHLQRIVELNSIDIEVYNAARDRFMNIVNGAEFDKAKLRQLRFMNLLFSASAKVRSLIRS